jgi:hypothetical protein
VPNSAVGFEPASDLSMAIWGALGAALWILLIHGVPIARRAVDGGLDWKGSTQQTLGLVGLIAIYLASGAAAPFLADAYATKEAFAFGLGWQSIFGEYTKRHASSG